MPNRPLVAPQVQSISFDPAAAMQDVASIQINRQRMDEARRKSMASMRMRQLAQQYPDSPLEFVDAVTREFPEEGFALGESYWKGVKENAQAHKAQTESSVANLEVGTRILQAARQNPALYPAAKQWITKMSPEVGGQLSEHYNEQEVDGWLQTGQKTSDFLKAQADAADRLTNKDTRGSVLTLFAGASNPQQWQTAVDLTTRSGLKPLLGLVASEWSPEAQAAAAQASISPEKQADDARLREAADEQKRQFGITSAISRGHLAVSQASEARQAKAAKEGRPLSETAEANIVNRLSGQWTKATASQNAINRQITIMETGLAAGRRGDLPQANEAVLQTFLKILDPDSVVREGEFQRLREGASLTTRVQTAFQRLNQGGFLPMSELEKYAQLAKEVQQSTQAVIEPVKERIGLTADHYKIPRNLVITDVVPPSTPPPPGSTKVGRFTVKPK